MGEEVGEALLRRRLVEAGKFHSTDEQGQLGDISFEKGLPTLRFFFYCVEFRQVSFDDVVFCLRVLGELENLDVFCADVEYGCSDVWSYSEHDPSVGAFSFWEEVAFKPGEGSFDDSDEITVFKVNVI